MNVEFVKARSQVVKLVRGFFDARGFTEVQTPRLVGLPGQEPHLEPFWTRLRQDFGGQAEIDAALITSPEYAMKRLLAEGLDEIYDLGPCFRNGEPWDGSHDPEFLLLEWYRRDAGIEELMEDVEAMVNSVGAQYIAPEGTMSHVPTKFRRLTVREAMKMYADVDLDPLLENRDALARVCREHGQTVSDADTWDDLFFKIFLSEVEPKLGWRDDGLPLTKGEMSRHTSGQRGWRPTFLTHYPASMAALARRDPKDPRYALRVELFIGNLELANGFAELSDPIEQRARFLEERALRQKLGKKTWPLDERFLSSLSNMGHAAGMAFGVDRLVMLLTGAPSINDILPFPARERFCPAQEKEKF